MKIEHLITLVRVGAIECIKEKGGDIKPPKDKSRIVFLKQNLTEEEAFKHEIYMISVFGRKDLGTGILQNRTNGGEGISGFTHSPETRAKLSESHKGEKNHNYGKNHSEECIRKISESHKGRIHSEESRRNMSEAHKGKTFSEEHKRNMSKVRKGKKGKPHSEETRKKMSETRKGKTLSEKHKIKISKGKKNPSEETRRKMGDGSRGKRWWNDSCGNRKKMVECPGNGWKLGMK